MGWWGFAKREQFMRNLHVNYESPLRLPQRTHRLHCVKLQGAGRKRDTRRDVFLGHLDGAMT